MLFRTALVLVSMAVAAFAQNNTIIDVLKNQPGETDQLIALLSLPQYQELITKLENNGTNFTVFAPDDAAISKTVQGLGVFADITNIILYHILNGTYATSDFKNDTTIIPTILTNSTVDNYPNHIGLPVGVGNNGSNVQVFYGLGVASVTKGNLYASNGVVHIIDSVLVPPFSPSLTIRQEGNLGALYNILNWTNLTSTLDNKHGVTVFAPVDSAIQAANVSRLTTPQIQNLIGYHVVSGIWFTSNFSSPAAMNLTTEQGSNITVRLNDGTIQITDMSGNETAKVVRSNIITNNGVLHVIDTVLIPSPNTTIPNNTNTNFTQPSSSASSYHYTDFHMAAFFAAIVAVAFSNLL